MISNCANNAGCADPFRTFNGMARRPFFKEVLFFSPFAAFVSFVLEKRLPRAPGGAGGNGCNPPGGAI